MKRLMLLAGMLAVVLLAAVPALAQSGEPEGGETVTATGVLERPEMTTYQYGTHAITDEDSGTLYALQSEDEALLDDAVGERVTVHGTTDPVYDDGAVEGGPPLVNVERVEPAGEDEGPTPGAPGDDEEVCFLPEGCDTTGDGQVDTAPGEPVTDDPAGTPGEDEEPARGQYGDEEPARGQYGDEEPARGQYSDEEPARGQYGDEEPPAGPVAGTPEAGAPSAGDEGDGPGIGLLPDTGGTPLLLGLGALLVGGGLLARRLLG